MKNKKPSVALIFGGAGREHSVSLCGAPYLYSLIDKEKFNVIPILIEQDGTAVSAQISASGEISTSETAAHLFRMFGRGGVIIDGDFIPLAAAIPLLHGDLGEDGTVQGALTSVGVPYVGCDIFAGSLCLDKIFTKIIAEHLGIPVARYRTVISGENPFSLGRKEAETPKNCDTSGDFNPHNKQISPAYDEQNAPYCGEQNALSFDDQSALSCGEKNINISLSQINDIEANLGYPLIVKPARLGSSVGISTAKTRDELISAIKKASFAAKDGRVLVEELLPVEAEAECAVYLSRDERIFTSPGTIRLGGAVYDYESKYGSPEDQHQMRNGRSEYNFNPAKKAEKSADQKISADGKLPREQAELIKEWSERLSSFIGIRHLSRIDFFITRDNKIIFNEINTFPGFTADSLYPKLLSLAGIDPAKAANAWLCEVAGI